MFNNSIFSVKKQ